MSKGHIKDSLKPRSNSKFSQGYFEQVRAPQKYTGRRPIIYRSSYELDAYTWADTSANVLSWTTEPFPIEYLDFKTGKTHKYWIDLVVKFKGKYDEKGAYHAGKTCLIEIKPLSQVPTAEEIKSGKMSPTKHKNFIKWDSCRKWCKMRHGFEFVIMTEVSLYALTGIQKYKKFTEKRKKSK